MFNDQLIPTDSLSYKCVSLQAIELQAIDDLIKVKNTNKGKN